MSKSRLKGTLVNSAGVSTSPLSPAAPVDPALAAPAPAVAPAPAPAVAPAPAPAVAPAPVPAVAPATAKPRSAATALVENEIESALLAYQKIHVEITALNEDLDDLRDRYPRQYKEVCDRLGIEEEEKESGKNESKFNFNKENVFNLILVVLIILALFFYWSYPPTPETSYQPPSQPVAESGKPADPAADSEVGMIIVPTSTVEAVATATAEATVEATAVPTAVPPTATIKVVPPTAVPPKVVQPTAVAYFYFESGEYDSSVVPDGVVCWGDAVAWDGNNFGDGVGPENPVYAVIPNSTTVYLVYGACSSESWEVVSKRLSTDPSTKDKTFVKVP